MSKTNPRYAYDPTHRVFRTPSPNTEIWRYTPLEKFLRLMGSRELHFTRASKFEDDFEGTVTARLEADLLEWERAWSMSPESSAEFRAQRRRVRNSVGISCWHKATHETEGMWVRYGGAGDCVAIRSTVGRLIATLPKKVNPHQSHIESVSIGEVDYIDFSRDTFPPYNTFYPYVHKRREFRHEQEVRAVLMITKGATADSEAGLATGFRVTETGLLLSIDVGTLIEAVVVSPKASDALSRDVRAHLDRFGLTSTPVVKSSMAGAPIY
jgi:hypothetical protein